MAALLSLDASCSYLDLNLGSCGGKDLAKVSGKDLVARLCKTDELLAGSVFKPGLEQDGFLLPRNESVNQLRKQRKLERDKTKGYKWFDMPATTVTDEIKNDIEVLQMRRILDKKRFYKTSISKKNFPKYFHVGTVVDNPVEFYSSRVPRKERRQTLVDELFADANFRKRNKKKFVQYLNAQTRKKRSKESYREGKRKFNGTKRKR